jgi:ferredoxin
MPNGGGKQGDIDIRVDRALCIVCGACSAVCPTEALIAEGLELVVYPDRCRPCARAAPVCPTGALTCPRLDGERRARS